MAELNENERKYLYFLVGDAMYAAFDRFDTIQRNNGLTNAQMVELVNHAAGEDVADSYQDWIDEGAE